ncbi:hypothetical protein ABFX02_11G017300 [Erythranthe guttata]
MDVKEPKPQRIYQAWRGSNTFVFGGRLVFGPDVSPLFFSTFLIVGPAFAFCVKISFIIKHRTNRNETALPWCYVLTVAILLTILDLFFLFLTSSRDPGIIPRNTKPPEYDETFEIDSTPSMEWVNGRTPHLKLPRTKDVFVNGHAVKVKYCDTCLLYRPPRVSHCSICNNCVQRFDHHCPWVGQCIGIRNYRYFYMFITTSTVLCVYVFVVSWINLVQTKGKATRAMSRDILSDFLIVYCFIVVWFIGGLTVFHFYLISTNQTTYENFRYRYDRKSNPYNKGIIENFREVFFSKIPPSMHDFRAFVKEDDIMAIEATDDDVAKGKIDIEMGNKFDDEGDNVLSLPKILRGVEFEGIEDILEHEGGSERADSDRFVVRVEVVANAEEKNAMV